jgi:hypothetical protein
MEAAIIENTKICTGCKKEMLATKEFFHSHKLGKLGLSALCKKCKLEYRKKHYKNNTEKEKEYSKKWKKDNPKRYQEIRESYKEVRNKKYDSEKEKQRLKNHRKNLSDGYVCQCMNVKLKEMPKKIIETKRLIINLKRELKNNNVKIK